MAHDQYSELLADDTGRAINQIILSLLGGVLLLVSLIARFTFEQPFFSALVAFLASLMLGVPLVIQAFKDLRDGRAEMNELVALGVVAAFAAGEYMTAGTIAFFMILATLVERRTALGARKTIESLIRLTPTKARKLGPDGSESEVEAKDLRPGDRVRIRPGDNIPGDGVVESGFSTVNEANITGESLPVDKDEGQDVFGGTINLSGLIDVKITKSGADTTLGQVQDLVLQAEQTKSSVMRLVDRYAHWYTPVVLMLALIVLVFTKDLNRVIALLLVACPCSIVLATPTAIVAALSAAARLGVLVKNVQDLERARGLTAILFDKTGTLTTGKLTVTRLGPLPGNEPAQLLSVAASLERHSTHPTARAVMEIAGRARVAVPDVTGFEEVSGRGVRGQLDGEQVLVGRMAWLQEQGVEMEFGDQEPPEGFSLLFVAKAGRLLGWIGLEDKTRVDAAQAMDDLRDLGVKQLVMVTGDRWSVARRVASEMHCTDVQAEVLPAQKLKVVDGLRAKGHTVAVIGDGVNDAPALAAGDLSIAMGAAGSDVAIHSASVALMNNNLNRIPFLIRLSRQTARIINQGVIFSVVYILVFVTLSAMGNIHPIVAAILHAASSLVVVFNSARLVRAGEDLETIPHEHAHGMQVRDTLTPQPVAS